MRRRIIGLAFCIAVLAVNAAAQGGSDSGGGPPATATIAVSGTEQQVSGAWDTASITISFNGYSETVSPGQYSSSASIASAFAAKFSRDDTSNGLSAQVICGSSSSLISFALASGTYGTVSITGSTTSFNMTPVGFQSQTVPTVTWPTPAPIGYGTALSTIQLDATASVPGTFAYSPASGTIPATGTDTLSVTFTRLRHGHRYADSRRGDGGHYNLRSQRNAEFDCFRARVRGNRRIFRQPDCYK